MYPNTSSFKQIFSFSMSIIQFSVHRVSKKRLAQYCSYPSVQDANKTHLSSQSLRYLLMPTAEYIHNSTYNVKPQNYSCKINCICKFFFILMQIYHLIIPPHTYFYKCVPDNTVETVSYFQILYFSFSYSRSVDLSVLLHLLQKSPQFLFHDFSPPVSFTATVITICLCLRSLPDNDQATVSYCKNTISLEIKNYSRKS